MKKAKKVKAFSLSQEVIEEIKKASLKENRSESQIVDLILKEAFKV